MVDAEDHNHNLDSCREEARRKSGPLLLGWGLLGATTTTRFVEAAGPGVMDLSTEDPADITGMLHWLAHVCGVGGSA